MFDARTLFGSEHASRAARARSGRLRSLAGIVALLAGIAGALEGHRAQARPDAAHVAQAPASAGDSRLWLPAGNFQGGDDICISWLSVVNLGVESTQAILIAFDRHPRSDGCVTVAGVGCTGLIAPGASWELNSGILVPNGAASGVLLSASARPLTQVDPAAPSAEPIASWLCARVAQAIESDACSAYDALAMGWQPGGTVYGVPYEALTGMPLAATLLRQCHGTTQPVSWSTSAYGALTDADLGAATDGVWEAVAPAVHAHAGGPSSRVYVQNAGDATASAVLELSRDGAVAASCTVEPIAPGRAAVVDVVGCAPDGFVGAARVRSDQPMAVVVETLDRDAALTYAAEAVHAGTSGSANQPLPDRSSAYASLAMGGLDHEATVHLMRLDEGLAPPATWSVRLRDASGAIAAEQDIALAPWAGGAVAFPAGTLSGTGSLEVVPQQVGQGPIVALAEVRTHAAAANADAVAVPASHLAAAGNASLKLPLLFADPISTGLSSELSITNLVEASGDVDVLIALSDAQGIVDVACATLGPRATRTFDLAATPGLIYPGFRGSASISATHWTHDGPPALTASAAVRLLPAWDAAASSDIVAFVAPARVGSTDGTPPGPWAVPDPCAPAIGPLRPPTAPRLVAGPPAPDVRYAGSVLALPTLDNSGGAADACIAELHVRNAGDEPSRVVLVTFAEGGWCPPQSSGPLSVSCIGTVAPGEARQVTTRTDLDGVPAASGLVLSISTRRLSELGISLPAVEGDPPVADVVCDWLSALSGDAAGYWSFRSALAQGERWRGIPLDVALGPALSIDVARRCALDPSVPPALDPVDPYRAPSVAAAETSFPSHGPYAYGAPVAYDRVAVPGRPGATLSTRLAVQNVGDRCATIEWWFREAGECSDIMAFNWALAPDQSIVLLRSQWDAAPAGWTGSVVVRSSVPLAVVTEHVVSGGGPASIRTTPARPGFDPFDVDLDGQVTAADEALVATAIGRSAGGPDWDDRMDLDGDGTVTEADRDLVAMHRCDGSWLPTPTPTATPSRAHRIFLPLMHR